MAGSHFGEDRAGEDRVREDTGGRQLPGPGEVFLDHLGHFVPDMGAAEADLVRLGFTLTPYTLHRTTPEEGQPATPSGTANQCCMLREGYLEVLCVTSPSTEIGARTQRQLDRYTGVHIVAVSTDDPVAKSHALRADGFDVQDPVNLRRPVPLADGSEAIAAFTVCRTPESAMPEGRVQYLSHLTEELVWQPRWMRHANGLTALRDVIILPVDLDESVSRYARFLEASPVRIADGIVRLPVARGGVVLAEREAAAPWSAGDPLPEVPAVIGYGLLADDLNETTAFLKDRDFDVSEIANGLARLTLPDTLGGFWFLAENEAAFPWQLPT